MNLRFAGKGRTVWRTAQNRIFQRKNVLIINSIWMVGGGDDGFKYRKIDDSFSFIFFLPGNQLDIIVDSHHH